MQTIHIIEKLITTIQTSPSSVYQIPWEDLWLCFTTELDCRKELYPDTQLRSIKELFQTRFQQLKQYLLTSDTTAIIRLLEEFTFALQLLPDADYTDQMLAKAHYQQARLTHYLEDTIVVIGDSHVNFFSGNENLTFSPIGKDMDVCPNITTNPFTIIHLGPCLAYHCNHPDTSTHFQEKVNYLCENFLKPNAHILFSLGEIDLRVHVFQQVTAQNRTYQEIIDTILSEYVTFLVSLQNKGYSVACWGPIASQSENCPVNPAFPRVGTEVERNQATAYFNQQLSIYCQQHQIPFLSIFEQMITDDFHTKEEYLSADHCHLGQKAMTLAQPVWKALLSL